MAEKKRFSFRFGFSEFLLIGLVLISSVLLAFNSGGFVLNIKKIGFTFVSTLDKGVHAVADGAGEGAATLTDAVSC